MTLPTPSPTVVFQKLEDGAVLFAPESETYFGLNEVGAHVWQALPPRCATLDALVAELATRYPEVPTSTIRADAAELLDALREAGLVVRGAGASGDAPSAS